MFFLSPLSIYVSARSHPYIYLSTSIHLHIYMTPAHPHCHSFTSILSFFLYRCLFHSTGQSHVSLSGHPSSSLQAVFLGTLDPGALWGDVLKGTVRPAPIRRRSGASSPNPSRLQSHSRSARVSDPRRFCSGPSYASGVRCRSEGAAAQHQPVVSCRQMAPVPLVARM